MKEEDFENKETIRIKGEEKDNVSEYYSYYC